MIQFDADLQACDSLSDSILIMLDLYQVQYITDGRYHLFCFRYYTDTFKVSIIDTDTDTILINLTFKLLYLLKY